MRHEAELNDNNKLKVFISYSRADLALADELVAGLERNDIAVTIDRRDLPYGEEWQKELADFIRGADTVVWLVSRASVKSKWCNWELGEVGRLKKRLIPVKIDNIAPDILPEALGKIQLLPTEGMFSLATHLGVLIETLNTDRAWIKEGTRQADLACEWMDNKRRSDFLLRGTALKDAEAWVARHPRSAPLPASEVLDFILASRHAATRRQRWFAASMIAVTFVSTGLTGLFLWQRSVAQDNARTATEQKTIAETQRGIAQGKEKEANAQRDLAASSARQAESTLLNYISSASIAESNAGRHQLAAALINQARLRRVAFPFDLGREVDRILERAALIVVANDLTSGVFPGIQGAFLGPEDDIVYLDDKAGGAAVSIATHATIRKWPGIEATVHMGSTPGTRLFARSDDERFFAINRSSLTGALEFTAKDNDGPSLVRIFDLSRNEVVATLRSSMFSEMAFVPGSNCLILAGIGHFKIVDARTGTVRGEYLLNRNAKKPVLTRDEFSHVEPDPASLLSYERVAVSPTTEQLFATNIFSGFGDAAKRSIDVFPYPASRLSSDDAQLVVTRGLTRLQFEENVSDVFTAPQLRLMIVPLENKVALYTVPDLKRQKSVEIEDGPISRAELSLDRRRLAVGTKSGSVDVLDLESTRIIAKTRIDAPVDGLSLSSDGNRVIAFSNKRKILHYLDVRTGAVRVFVLPEFEILSVDIARDGSSLLVSTTQAVVRLDLAATAALAWNDSAEGPSYALGSKLRIFRGRNDGLLIVDSSGTRLGRALEGRHVEWIAVAGDALVAASYRSKSNFDDPALSILTVSDDEAVITERITPLEPALATAVLQDLNNRHSSSSLVSGRNLSAAMSAKQLTLLIGHALIDIALSETNHPEQCLPMVTLAWCSIRMSSTNGERVTDLVDLKQINIDKVKQINLLQISIPDRSFTVDVTSALSSSGKYALTGAKGAFFVQDLDQVRRDNIGIILESSRFADQMLPADKKDISLGQVRSLAGGEGFIVNLGNGYIAIIIIQDAVVRGSVVACPSSFCTATPAQEANLLIYNDEYSWSPFSDNRILEPILFNLRTKARVTLKGHEDFVNRVAIGTKGPLLATGDRRGRVIIWNSDEGIELARFELNDPIESLLSGKDGQTYLALTRGGAWKLDVAKLGLLGPQALEYVGASARTADIEAAERARLALDKLPNPYQVDRKVPSPLPEDPSERCAALSSHPLDPQRVGEGVPFVAIKGDEAIEACEAALAIHNADGRSLYHLSRAFNSAKRDDQAHAVLLRAVRAGYAMAAASLFVAEDNYMDDDLKALSHQIRTLVENAAARGEPLAVYELAREAYLRLNDASTLRPALEAGVPSAFLLESKRLAKINTPAAVEETYLKSSIADLLWIRLFASEDREVRNLRYNSAMRLSKTRVIELHRQAVAEAEKLLSLWSRAGLSRSQETDASRGGIASTGDRK